MNNKSKIFLVIFLSIVVFNSLFLIIFCFGNPQWHKYIYYFQSNIYPNQGGRAIKVPEGFSGIWVDWHLYAGKTSEVEYKNGLLSGKYILYSNFGRQKIEERYFINNTPVGIHIRWGNNGNIIAKGDYNKGLLWEGTFLEFNKDSKKFTIGEYKSGKLINSEPYQPNYMVISEKIGTEEKGKD